MTEENLVSRRGVLCGLAVLALGIAPESAIASGTVKVLANGKVEVSLAANPALKKVGGVVQFTNSNNEPIALVRISKASTGYRALSLACTHEGVTVEREGNAWRCRLGHRAKFQLNGKVVEGPATQNLRTLPVKAGKRSIVVG